ncbi:phospholipase A2 [Achlya hypogyna]|uniref:Phospholipase A2 n=1 Tax=Achlya hypogyna TaxID=1202772 RepID=A0A0A7CN75_ACHHY|nr:secreted protein [Achlya hypogyna]OQR92727.1 phospholipase A2 [Achlya hypogyna]
MMRSVLGVCVALALLSTTDAMFDSNPVCDARSEICSSAKKGGKKVLAPKRDYKIWANGCGTESMGFSVMADDGTDFTSCCNWHDACYSICGISKNFCERRFEKCMKDKCATEDDPKACQSMADIYAMGPKLMGCPAYTKAQKEACVCVDKDKVAAKNRARLEYFLEAHGTGADSVDDLLAKYAGKEPTMFFRLLSKFPDALVIKEKVKTDKESMFERLKKDIAKEKEASAPDDEIVEHIEL